jgi:hypothetical protein
VFWLSQLVQHFTEAGLCVKTAKVSSESSWFLDGAFAACTAVFVASRAPFGGPRAWGPPCLRHKTGSAAAHRPWALDLGPTCHALLLHLHLVPLRVGTGCRMAGF